MTGEDEAETLHAACRRLGLVAVQANESSYAVYDTGCRKYKCFYNPASSPVWPPESNTVRGLADFLQVQFFEYYKFPNRFKIVSNEFLGMSREELELRLAVMGK